MATRYGGDAVKRSTILFRCRRVRGSAGDQYRWISQNSDEMHPFVRPLVLVFYYVTAASEMNSASASAPTDRGFEPHGWCAIPAACASAVWTTHVAFHLQFTQIHIKFTLNNV